MRTVALGLLIAATIAACSAAPANDCPQFDDALAFDDALRRAMCERGIQCYDDGYGELASGLLDHCWLPPSSADLCSDLVSGRRVFHAELAAPCLDALAARVGTPCLAEPDYGELRPDGWTHMPTACAGVVTETPPSAFGDCLRDGCPDDMRCIANSAGCGGHCVAEGHEGDACTLGCARGFYCDGTPAMCHAPCNGLDCGSGSYCLDDACAPLPVLGEPCDAIGFPRVCDGARLYCHTRTSLCTTAALPSEPCDPDGGPESCIAGSCDAATRACVADARCYPVASLLDEYCVPDEPYCSSDMTCTNDPSRVLCTSDGDSEGVDECPPGYACDLRHPDRFGGFDATLAPCVLRAAVGAACTDSVICADGSTCSNGRCVRLPLLDEACGAERVCLAGMACDAGRCVAILPSDIGEICDALHACAWGACHDGVCAWITPRVACATDHECQAEVCEGRCPDFVNAGEGEPCDFTDHRCAHGSQCTPNGVGGTICRTRCP